MPRRPRSIPRQEPRRRLQQARLEPLEARANRLLQRDLARGGAFAVDARLDFCTEGAELVIDLKEGVLRRWWREVGEAPLGAGDELGELLFDLGEAGEGARH